MQDFIYIDEVTSFMQIVFLGMVLGFPVCYFVECLKNTEIKDEKFYFTASVLVSVTFGSLFSLSFTDMTVYECIWLCVMLWLSSQGFYENLKTSDGIFGQYFAGITKRFPTEESVPGREEEIIFPVNYIGISTPFSKAHPAVDFGFSFSHGGKNQDIIAPCDMDIVSAGESKAIGKYIRAHATVNDEKYTFRFIHLSDISVKNGDAVTIGETIGKMGNTGTECDGYHLHFDIWKGHTSDLSGSSSRYEKSINPIDVCRLGKGQTVGEETDGKYDIKRGQYAQA